MTMTMQEKQDTKPLLKFILSNLYTYCAESPYRSQKDSFPVHHDAEKMVKISISLMYQCVIMFNHFILQVGRQFLIFKLLSYNCLFQSIMMQNKLLEIIIWSQLYLVRLLSFLHRYLIR